MPGPVKVWEGVRSAQAWGPVCPDPAAHRRGSRRIRLPASLLGRERRLPGAQRLDAEPRPGSASAGDGLDARRRLHQRLFDGVLCLRRQVAERIRRRRRGEPEPPAQRHRHPRPLRLRRRSTRSPRHTGMADLVAALQWIHDNIAVFGGDPGNVTIFGQSGGGGKVTRLMHMPAAKGLFHKVICESGSTVDYRASDPAEIIKGQQARCRADPEEPGPRWQPAGQAQEGALSRPDCRGHAANQTVGAQLGRTIGWDPVADDQYVLREFCDWADAIPYIAGNVMSEFNSNLPKAEFDKNEWTAAADRRTADRCLRRQEGRSRRGVQQAAAAQEGPGRAVRRQPFPSRHQADAGPQTGEGQRPGLLLSVHLRISREWRHDGISLRGDRIRVPRPQRAPLRVATGGTPAALALQDKVSQAWVNFARTGNPSNRGSPGSLTRRRTSRSWSSTRPPDPARSVTRSS